ncbi:MAG: methyltransferase [Labilithrix sp.]|nr:methyltransferase [Labilithrix sp.]MCW5810924.1 methyltransferase [Labilithrix sp.]
MTTSSDIATRLGDPGFTPGIKTLRALLDLSGADDEDTAKLAARAVLRIERQYAGRVAKAVVTRAREAARPARGRLTQLAGRLVAEARDPDGDARAWLLDALGDDDPKTRRAATRALGKLAPAPEITAALEAAFARAASDDDKKALGLALGKAGVAVGQTGRAGLIAEREEARRSPGAIDLLRAPASPLRVFHKTRSGLEEIVKREIGRGARFFAPGVVETKLAGPLAEALAIRTAAEIAFPLADREVEDLPSDVADALASEEALAIFRAFTSTKAPIRFRVALARGGHQRALVWKIAEATRARTKELVNDPKESTWEVAVDVAGSRLRIELVPRGFVDPRFSYREDVVPASSHPTIAAALARVAPRRDDDVVWDPFAGAGAELIERAKLGPYARLFGTDIESAAVAAARANARRAGVSRILVERGDALDPLVPPDGVTTIITNPPMGRRVQRGTHAELLERFVDRAAEVLVPGGALVWIVPEPQRLRARAAEAGFVLESATSLDMSGFSAELSVYVKPGLSRTRKRR